MYLYQSISVTIQCFNVVLLHEHSPAAMIQTSDLISRLNFDFNFLLCFLPCDALRCTVFVIVILSVRLSVHPSVTLVDCVHMV